ncbi:Gfo/Idh/MocA family protein [Fictibacillus fluitans]|uniref:Gfo/Idh/MocA family oxidoreductase n=1 Tax=Fictibacillus fluitans TaxID=3058422 RepID=A0ABT8HT02_9BACL|nr:Gfo/Idh/MocA family oxidoreductase [Fictibacillus sp. NE201]MDN4523886.1 Gfo/Idh/MocA family oxidoreductase [Fictibacillus sp. NE201]
MVHPIRFSIIGGGSFRALYYLRIARMLPQKFHIAGMVVRDETKGRELEERWNVRTYRNLEQLLQSEHPDFVVTSVTGSVNARYVLELGDMDIPVLTETPPGSTLQELYTLHDELTLKKKKIQVAEQYHLHPLHAARLSLIQSGMLGKVTETTVSISHFYHGVSLIRKMLGITFEDAEITAKRFTTSILAGPGREGPPKEEKLITAERDLAWLQFGEKLGIYDFTKDQHRSWIRSNHLSVRGTKGELFDERISVLTDYQTPLPLTFQRVNKGEQENQEGYYLDGILAGERWVYKNPFSPARLYDDEIAIATCLQKMADYVTGGPNFYSLQEASQDHYLGLMIQEAIETGQTVMTSKQPWSEE